MDKADNAGASDQNQDTGVDQGTNDTGADNLETGADGKPTPYGSQKRRAEIAEDTAKIYKQQLIDAGILDKDGKPKAKTETTTPTQVTATQSDDLVRARLEARGVLDESEQDVVIEAAKVLGVTPIKALENDIVKGRLAALKAENATKNATPPPSRGGGTSTNIARLADKAQETGELPSDPKLKADVKAELKRRSK